MELESDFGHRIGVGVPQKIRTLRIPGDLHRRQPSNIIPCAITDSTVYSASAMSTLLFAML